jgi:D-3-phosphoglycerate dehydrogenase
MKILVAGDNFVPVDYFARAFASLDGHEIDFVDMGAEPGDGAASVREFIGSPTRLVEALDGHEVLVVHAAPVTGEVLAAATDLKLICCARGGAVNVDMTAATDRGIPVATTPGKNADAVADLTIAFLIMLARRMAPAQVFARDAWGSSADNFAGAGFLGVELAGRSLGLVGLGMVGGCVSERAIALGMNVSAFDPYVSGDTGAVELVSFDQLLAQSQFVSLHARATAETTNLMGPEAFAAMRKDGVLVNTARETLVDEDGLIQALDTGEIAAAALDVVRPRPDGELSPLLGRDDVVVTPHIGGATVETLARGARMAVAEVERFAAGLPLISMANREALVGR